MAFSLGHIEYLQRRLPLPAATIGDTCAAIRLIRVVRIGAQPSTSSAAAAISASSDLIIGLYALKIPVALLISGGPEGASLCLGVWSASAQGNIDRKLSVWADV